MSIIKQYWDLHDFCGSYGRVIPHITDRQGHFTKFHCADSRHDDSETIICSEEQGEQIGTLMGILSMHGFIVEFNDRNELLFCTKDELEKLQEQSEIEKKEEEKRREELEAKKPENPAQPKGLKITADIQDRRFQAYLKCIYYKDKMHTARIAGYLTPPYPWGDNSFKSMICKDDCLFPNCPFYETRLLEELRHNHRTDYDEWVVEFNKNANGIH